MKIFHGPRLLKIYVNSPALYIGRVISALIAFYFIRKTFEAISSGLIVKNSQAYNIETETFGFWLHTLSLAAIAFIFINICLGLRLKSSKSNNQ